MTTKPPSKPTDKPRQLTKEGSDGIQALLIKCPKEVQLFFSALEAENLRLQKRIAKLEVESISANSRVKALEELKPESKLRDLSDEELTRKLEESITQMGYIKKPNI